MKEDYSCLDGSRANKENKVLLVYPKVGSEAKGMSLYPPLSVLTLAGYLRDYPVAIFDQRVDDLSKLHGLLDQEPVCVGISTMTGVQIKHSLKLAEIAKEKGIPTVFGGVHPTILPEQTKEDRRVDYVINGDGEISFRNIVELLKDGKKPEPITKSPMISLKNYPPIPYELVDVEKYIHTVIISGRALPFSFSRGCPFECTFCCNPLTSEGKWRVMDIDKAMGQLEDMVSEHNLDSIIFPDENLPVNPKIMNALAKRINGRFKWNMQARMNSLLNYDLGFLEEMGGWRFSCGIESGSQRVLDAIKKRETIGEYIEANRALAKTNIRVWYNYIIGFPGEDVNDLKATTDLALQMLDENPRAVNSTFSMLVPYPGTEIAKKYVQSNLLPQSFEGWADFGRYNFSVGWYTEDMKRLYERIYYSSKFTGKKLLEHFPEDKELEEYTAVLTKKWRNFDFQDNNEWQGLMEKGKKMLEKLFGDNAY